jgi:hypothetical protein
MSLDSPFDILPWLDLAEILDIRKKDALSYPQCSPLIFFVV